MDQLKTKHSQLNTLYYPRIIAAGDAGWTVEFGAEIDPAVNDRVLAFADALAGQSIEGLVEVVPTFCAATVYFDPLIADADDLAQHLLAAAASTAAKGDTRREAKLVEVPVHYGGDFGPDLEALAGEAGLPVERVIALHAAVEYRVYMLGFMPGFPYLGRVPDAIALPRLATPRQAVPAGSVGIAGHQTGIYPIDCPGGWRLIGRTPLRLYDPQREPPFLFAPGDRVRFLPID